MQAHADTLSEKPRHFTADLLSDGPGDDVKATIGRGLWGLGLSACYGLALGTRGGGTSLLQHAAGIPVGLCVMAVVSVPSLYVFLSLFDVSVKPQGLLRAASRAVATTGLLLAGLAPAALLFVLTSDGLGVARALGGAGLVVALVLGIVKLLRDVGAEISTVSDLRSLTARLALGGYGLFCLAFALRIWFALPLFGGGR